MIVTKDRDELAVTAVRTTSCPSCGTTLRAEEEFWQPVSRGSEEMALANLLRRLSRWKAERPYCDGCPEPLPVWPTTW